MRRGSRAAALVAALLITALMFAVGVGFLGQRSGQYQAAQEQINYLQALAVADAGLADAYTKLSKDIDFPPLRAADQSVFSYQDELLDNAGTRVGTYRVSIDLEYQNFPFELVRVTSTGVLGDVASPTAQVSRTMEIDIAELERGSNPLRLTPNPELFRTIGIRTNE